VAASSYRFPEFISAIDDYITGQKIEKATEIKTVKDRNCN
jgi:hypothetical protein